MDVSGCLSNEGSEDLSISVADIPLCTPMSVALRVTPVTGLTPAQVLSRLDAAGIAAVQPYPDILPEALLLPASRHPDRAAASAPALHSVVLGRTCAEAVLSGAVAYAPGVAAWPRVCVEHGTQARVYADVSDGRLRGGVTNGAAGARGLVCLGVGILRMQTRDEVFGRGARGAAVEMTRPVFAAPCTSSAEQAVWGYGREGECGIALVRQTFTSQLVGRVAMGYGGTPGRVLDMCAAPGGKTAHVAALRSEAGQAWGVTAVARTKKKGAAMETRLRELGVGEGEVEVVVGDARAAEKMFGAGSFECVLLDAPCSGSGTRPRLNGWDLRNGVDERLVADCAAMQRRLMRVAARVVRKGGTVVYSTCSDEWAEGEGVVTWVMHEVEELGLEAVDALPGFKEGRANSRRARGGPEKVNAWVAERCLRFTSMDEEDVHNMHTAFFIAKFAKVK